MTLFLLHSIGVCCQVAASLKNMLLHRWWMVQYSFFALSSSAMAFSRQENGKATASMAEVELELQTANTQSTCRHCIVLPSHWLHYCWLCHCQFFFASAMVCWAFGAVVLNCCAQRRHVLEAKKQNIET